jgi:hypothetical protein
MNLKYILYLKLSYPSNMSDDENDFVLSEEENENLTFDQAKRYKILFGKHKGKRLVTLIRTSKGRDYMRYLLSWAELREEARSNISKCLEEYENFKEGKKSERK